MSEQIFIEGLKSGPPSGSKIGEPSPLVEGMQISARSRNPTRKELGGALARSRRDLVVRLVGGQASRNRTVPNLREIAGTLVPRAFADGVAGGREREGKMCQVLTEERFERGDCKISSRSNYSCGPRPSMFEQIGGQASPIRTVPNLREIAGTLVPRAFAEGVAGGCEREGRLCQILTKERFERRDCKISSRSNYSYGRRPGMFERIFMVRVKSGPPPG